MLNIFKKKESIDSDVITRQIHQEIDNLEEVSIKAVKKLLEDTKVITPDQLTNKANIMAKLGFSDSNEVISQFRSFKQKESKFNSLEKEFNHLNTLRTVYTTEKLLPWKDFSEVLRKYGLCVAPANYYLKDVPEKNLLEISKAKKVEEMHLAYEGTARVTLSGTGKDYGYTHLVEKAEALIKNKNFRDVNQLKSCLRQNITSYEIDTFLNLEVTSSDYIGLYISAPISHFDTKMLKQIKANVFGLKTTQRIEGLKDPIAFNFLGDLNNKPNYVRILSKWGTSDDQSYLDPLVQNEKHN